MLSLECINAGEYELILLVYMVFNILDVKDLYKLRVVVAFEDNDV
jgi:hypothetical protein